MVGYFNLGPFICFVAEKKPLVDYQAVLAFVLPGLLFVFLWCLFLIYMHKYFKEPDTSNILFYDELKYSEEKAEELIVDEDEADKSSSPSLVSIPTDAMTTDKKALLMILLISSIVFESILILVPNINTWLNFPFAMLGNSIRKWYLL